VELYNTGMLPNLLTAGALKFSPLLAVVAANGPGPATAESPSLLTQGGPVMWLLLLASAAALAVFIERLLHFHRAQINSAEFMNGVRTVLKRANVVEAVSICDATPGPVSHLVKTAILNRDHGRERLREALEEAGLAEVPRLEQRLNLLATVSQLAPLLGLLGTVLGLARVFHEMELNGVNANIGQLSHGVWTALLCMGMGLAVAIPAYAGYNYLVSRVNAIVLDMERAATEIVNIVTETNGPRAS
jgi:biopolymer transport protein ExbB